jgi:hypothetical protein
MRRSVLIPAVMAAVVLGAAGSPMAAADSLVGELVDSACYATRGMKAKGANHAQCALACAQKGHRLALVTVTGDVYMVTGALTEDNNAKLIPLMSRTVVVTGSVGEVRVQDGIVQDSSVSGINVLESTLLESDAKGDGSGDGRRPTASKGGVVTKTVRKGDFREGDVKEGVVKIIEAISVELTVAIK